VNQHNQHIAHSTQTPYSSSNITFTNSVTVIVGKILKYGSQHILYVLNMTDSA